MFILNKKLERYWKDISIFKLGSGRLKQADCQKKTSKFVNISSVKWSDQGNFLKSQGNFFCHFHVPFFSPYF